MQLIRILLVLVSTLTLLSCTKRKDKLPHDLKYEETLRVNLSAEPPTLDWNRAADVQSGLIIENLMEGLMDYDFSDPDLSVKGALAEKWEFVGDTSRWRFHLRKGVKWSDGQDFVAQHVVDGWERLLNPATASEYSYFLYGLKNGRAYNEGKITDFSQVGVKIVNPHQIDVELDGPQSYFPYLLTHTSTYPLRKDIVEKGGDAWTEPKNIVTLGPYLLKIWEHDSLVILEANPTYYGQKPFVKNVLARIVKDQFTAKNLFDAKKLDALMDLPSVELASLKKRKEYRETGILGTYYLGFNANKAPLDNLSVRKALIQAIDRKQITDMLGGGQVPLSSWVPPGMFGYEPDFGIGFNVEQARKLLDEAGYKDRGTFPTIYFGFNTNEDHKRVAENVQMQLKKNLGINVELKNGEWKVYLDSLKTDPPHIFRMGWIADYPDPDNFFALMTSYSNNNHTLWGNSQFDKLIGEAKTEADKQERRRMYAKAQKILVEEDSPVMPIFAYVSQLLVADRVDNFPINSMLKFRYKEVKLK
ncbi:MAG: peptide ABC transporter substrate-binding protein [Pseudobdellovibrionaceae bacterium]|nr:peptide ABC transporter substrate-binding protein [Bdellovibrionales bacterium]USN46161.1 MAG: peptide ABC transporter substrate-binding protein [Pseudobdellovibrionaceae bacterium]